MKVYKCMNKCIWCMKINKTRKITYVGNLLKVFKKKN